MLIKKWCDQLFLMLKKKGVNCIIDAIFMFSFLLILFVGFVTIFKTPKKYSHLENRILSSFTVPTLATFSNGTFQDNLESALSDQFILSRKIKEESMNLLNFVDYRNINKKICNNRYVYINSTLATFDCSDYIVTLPETADKNQANFENHLTYYNKLNELSDVYYYVISRSAAFDFENDKLSIDTYKYLVNNLEGDYHISALDCNDFETYKKYFFKTDHHWNLYGSYQGYKDIVKLLKIKDDVLEPKGIKTIDGPPFLGSSGKSGKIAYIKEKFSYYDFDFKEHYELIDGRLTKYGDSDFTSNDIKFLDYYLTVYGDNLREVEFDFQNEKKDNLLIIGSSYTNPINRLIASHFNKTYVIDLRSFDSLDFEEYLKLKEIDKVLIVASTESVFNKLFNLLEVE